MRARASSPLPWLGGLLALYLLAPIAAFVVRLGGGVSSVPGIGAALATSLLTATVATVIVGLLGTPLAYLLARGTGLAARMLLALVALPLALPALMSGLLLLYVVGPYTTAGRLFGGQLTETRAGIVLAQVFVAAPFLILTARAAFASVDPALEDVAASLGHGPLARFMRVAVPAALPGIAAGLLLAWLRAFGEFGATLILAYHPYSLPVFTWVQFSATGLPATMLPVAVALGAAVVVVVLAGEPVRRRRGGGTHARLAPDLRGERSDEPLRFALSKRLGDFSLQLDHHGNSQRLAVLGPSGAGKTLTLRLLAGLTRPEPGGYLRAGDRRLDLLDAERREVGYVPQQSALLPRLTVWRQVTFGARTKPELAAWWLERLALSGLEQRFPEELSGGQRRRVAIARALATGPRLLLLDEPFTGLDAPVRDGLRRDLRRLQHELNLSTVIVTHDPQEAAQLADEIIVLKSGRILQSGNRESVFREPGSPAVAALLGIANAHLGAVIEPGVIRSSGAEILVPTGALAPGAKVAWCVRPERISLAPGGHYRATLIDDVDLGSVRELRVRLAGSLELVVRTDEASATPAGETLGIEMPGEHISIWPQPVLSEPQPPM